MRRSATGLRRRDQTEVMNVPVEAHPFGRPIGALAASPEMSDQAFLGKSNEDPSRFRRMSLGEVTEPATQECVGPVDDILDGHPAESRAGEVAQVVPRALLC